MELVRAAKAANTKMAMPAPRASSWPPRMPASRLDSRSVTALAMAAAITTIKMATKMLGRYAIKPRSRSEIGLGPNTPNASWSTNNMTAQKTTLARRIGGVVLAAGQGLAGSPPRSTMRSKPTRSRTRSRMREMILATEVANDQDDQGGSQLGQERGHIRPGVLDAALEVNGEDQVLLLGGEVRLR